MFDIRMIWRPIGLVICLLLGVVTGAGAAGETPKIGLVLSGGGARGVAHVGVLKVLDELRIPVHVVTGTSMGAIIGGLYASGMTPEEIETELEQIDWHDILNDNPARTDLGYRRKREDDEFLVRTKIGFNQGQFEVPQGLLQGQKLLLLLRALTLPVARIHNFDDLPIPFRAVATDISTGKAVVLDKGDLALAMRASSSIPSVFAPVEIDGRLLVDGGVSDNLPVSVARDMGADILIVVDVSTPLSSQDQLKSVLAITDQLTTIMTRNNTEASIRAMATEDVLIVPDLAGVSTTDFVSALKALTPGVEAARAQQQRLSRLSVSEARYRRFLKRAEMVDKHKPVVQFMRIENHSRLADQVISRYFDVKLGEPLDERSLANSIGHLYGLDLFKEVSYRLVEEDGTTGIVVDVKEKPWGPNYLQAGLKFRGEWNEGNGFNLGFSYLATAINPLGGEFRSIVELGDNARLFAEFYQPLDTNRAWFVNPKAEISRAFVGRYQDGKNLGQFIQSQALLGLEGGMALADWGELRFGWRVGRGDLEANVGDPGIDEKAFGIGQLFVRLGADTLDNLYFPTNGRWFQSEFRSFSPNWGDDHQYEQIYLDWGSAFNWDKQSTLLTRARAGYTLQDNAPLQGLFKLGGFMNLSGYNRNEFSGQHMAHLMGAYLHRLNKESLMPIYVGGSLEAGNTWQNRDDFGRQWLFGASAFLGLDTFMGPIYMGYALGEQGHRSLFMYLGNLL